MTVSVMKLQRPVHLAHSSVCLAYGSLLFFNGSTLGTSVLSNMLRGDSHPAWNPQASSNSPLPSFCYLLFHSQHSTFASMDSPPRWSFYFTFKHCLQRISVTVLSPKEEIVTEEPWFVCRLQSSTFANTQGEAGIRHITLQSL